MAFLLLLFGASSSLSSQFRTGAAAAAAVAVVQSTRPPTKAAAAAFAFSVPFDEDKSSTKKGREHTMTIDAPPPPQRRRREGDTAASDENKRRQWGVLERVSTPTTTSNERKGPPFETYRLFMNDDGTYPNNPHHPLLLFRSAFANGSRTEGEKLIVDGGWTSPWAWGIFQYHHYHSTMWELLLCVQGSATVQLGGDAGPTVRIDKGDLVLIPPGFAHKELDSSNGFTLLGSYPTVGCAGPLDTVRGTPTDEQRDNIARCVAPEREPVLGVRLSDLY